MDFDHDSLSNTSVLKGHLYKTVCLFKNKVLKESGAWVAAETGKSQQKGREKVLFFNKTNQVIYSQTEIQMVQGHHRRTWRDTVWSEGLRGEASTPVPQTAPCHPQGFRKLDMYYPPLLSNLILNSSLVLPSTKLNIMYFTVPFPYSNSL